MDNPTRTDEPFQQCRQSEVGERYKRGEFDIALALSRALLKVPNLNLPNYKGTGLSITERDKLTVERNLAMLYKNEGTNPQMLKPLTDPNGTFEQLEELAEMTCLFYVEEFLPFLVTKDLAGHEWQPTFLKNGSIVYRKIDRGPHQLEDPRLGIRSILNAFYNVYGRPNEKVNEDFEDAQNMCWQIQRIACIFYIPPEDTRLKKYRAETLARNGAILYEPFVLAHRFKHELLRENQIKILKIATMAYFDEMRAIMDEIRPRASKAGGAAFLWLPVDSDSDDAIAYRARRDEDAYICFDTELVIELHLVSRKYLNLFTRFLCKMRSERLELLLLKYLEEDGVDVRISRAFYLSSLTQSRWFGPDYMPEYVKQRTS
ncbi:hypothetical protein BJ508DRAFT_418508, partial [Ascobolus immersus RN42]